MMIDVVRVRSLGAHKLEIEFSDGTIGVRDFSFVRQKSGPMAEPLQKSGLFCARAYRRRRAHMA